MKNRREFLGYAGASAAAAAGFPAVVKSSALGMNGAIAPSIQKHLSREMRAPWKL